MPEFYEHLTPMPYEQAVHKAEKLAKDLRAEGYIVTNGVSAIKDRYLRVKAGWQRSAPTNISAQSQS